MNKDLSPTEGACHCGTVRFTVKLTNGLHTVRRCNCSFCRMRGAVVVSAQLEDIHITAGAEALTLYDSTARPPSITSARNAGSTPITSAVPIRSNMG